MAKHRRQICGVVVFASSITTDASPHEVLRVTRAAAQRLAKIEGKQVSSGRLRSDTVLNRCKLRLYPDKGGRTFTVSPIGGRVTIASDLSGTGAKKRRK